MIVVRGPNIIDSNAFTVVYTDCCLEGFGIKNIIAVSFESLE